MVVEAGALPIFDCQLPICPTNFSLSREEVWPRFDPEALDYGHDKLKFVGQIGNAPRSQHPLTENEGHQRGLFEECF